MMEQEARITCIAELKKMAELPYEDIASTRGIPVIRPIYEVTFVSEGEEILFSLSEFEYDVLEAGMKGQLVYHKKKYCNELIAFTDEIRGEIIREVKD